VKYPSLSGETHGVLERLPSSPPGHPQGRQSHNPLMLRYEAGGFNWSHQDLYATSVFPEMVFLLGPKDAMKAEN